MGLAGPRRASKPSNCSLHLRISSFFVLTREANRTGPTTQSSLQPRPPARYADCCRPLVHFDRWTARDPAETHASRPDHRDSWGPFHDATTSDGVVRVGHASPE